MPAIPPRTALPLPTGRGWWLVAAGIGIGLVLFLLLWSGQRGDRDLEQLDEVQRPAAAAPAFRPLPVPPASGGRAVDAPDDRPGAARIETPTTPPARTAPAMPVPTEALPPSAGSPISAPVPVASPGPRYPARALRRGESGEVLLRIQVDARGIPAAVDVVSSSGSRDLDRAAAAAVRRWRFRPAMQDGTAVAGVVNVPITFETGR